MSNTKQTQIPSPPIVCLGEGGKNFCDSIPSGPRKNRWNRDSRLLIATNLFRRAQGFVRDSEATLFQKSQSHTKEMVDVDKSALCWVSQYYHTISQSKESLLKIVYSDKSTVMLTTPENTQLFEGQDDIFTVFLNILGSYTKDCKVQLLKIDFHKSPGPEGSIVVCCRGVYCGKEKETEFMQYFVLVPTRGKTKTYHIAHEHLRVEKSEEIAAPPPPPPASLNEETNNLISELRASVPSANIRVQPAAPPPKKEEARNDVDDRKPRERKPRKELPPKPEAEKADTSVKAEEKQTKPSAKAPQAVEERDFSDHKRRFFCRLFDLNTAWNYGEVRKACKSYGKVIEIKWIAGYDAIVEMETLEGALALQEQKKITIGDLEIPVKRSTLAHFESAPQEPEPRPYRKGTRGGFKREEA